MSGRLADADMPSPPLASLSIRSRDTEETFFTRGLFSIAAEAFDAKPAVFETSRTFQNFSRRKSTARCYL